MRVISETGEAPAARPDNVVPINPDAAVWPRQTPQMSAKELQRRLGQAIRRRRRIIDITLVELARACGVSFQQVQKYEAGTCSISAAQLWNIACALDVPIAQLFEGAAAAANAA